MCGASLTMLWLARRSGGGLYHEVRSELEAARRRRSGFFDSDRWYRCVAEFEFLLQW